MRVSTLFDSIVLDGQPDGWIDGQTKPLQTRESVTEKTFYENDVKKLTMIGRNALGGTILVKMTLQNIYSI